MLKMLLQSVRDQAGFTISSKRECVMLSELILESTDIFISYNTLRRIYGLAPMVTPRAHTLDTLALYCGFYSFQDYCSSARNLASWKASEDIYQLLAEGQLEEVFLTIQSTPAHAQRMDLLVRLCRELILENRSDDLKRLFESSSLQIQAWEYSHQLHLGVSLGLLFRSHPDVGTPLLEVPSFLNFVYLTHVDYSHLNGYYGRWTERLSTITTNTGVHLFSRCILAFRQFLNDAPIVPVSWDDGVQKLHPILRSRLFSVAWMTGRTDFDTLWAELHSKASSPEDHPLPLTWVHEIHLFGLLTEDVELLEHLNQWTFQLKNLAHFEQHHVQLNLLTDLALSLEQNNHELARSIERKFKLSQVYPAYREMVELIWRRLRLPITSDPKREQVLMLTLIDKLNYPYLKRTFPVGE